ncbi:unnamed protein product [Coregonus sp. 'balchen']|nr:unnamed protein product [Coregonus sp. 'balchen']
MGEWPSWSPLAGDKFEEICKEAHLLASQLVINQQHPDVGETNGNLTVSKEEPKEDFVLDAGAKLGMFSKPVDAVLSPIKRETFCVQDRPLKQLPPAIQQRLLRAGGVSNSTKRRVSTSSPVRAGTTTQPKMVLRGRECLQHQGVAPGGRNSSRAASSEDLLSDTASVASDISDTSLNSSLQGKRTLVPPSKILGELKTSLNSSMSGLNGRLPTGMSRPATKTLRSTLIGQAPEPPSTTVARRSISAQGRKPSEPDQSKPVQATPMKSVEPAATATPLYQNPAKRDMERMSSVPNIPTSTSVKTEHVIRGNPKLKAFIAPTPTSQFKMRSEDHEAN